MPASPHPTTRAWRRPRLRRALVALTSAGLLLVGGLWTAPSAAADPGSVSTVGLGSDGQLGSGSTANRTAFGPVAGLPDITHVEGGREHVLALDSTGHVWSWGDGSKGALGLGTIVDHSSPVQVPGL